MNIASLRALIENISPYAVVGEEVAPPSRLLPTIRFHFLEPVSRAFEAAFLEHVRPFLPVHLLATVSHRVPRGPSAPPVEDPPGVFYHAPLEACGACGTRAISGPPSARRRCGFCGARA